MQDKNSKFYTDKPLYDHNIDYDVSHLPKLLQEIIKELEKYDAEGDWFNYDLKFPELDITAKSYLINNRISEYDYKTLLKKYGGIYD